MEEQNSNFRWLVVVLFFLGGFLNYFSLFCMPPLFMEILEQIPMTKTQMGSVMGVALLAGALFGPLGGGLSDRVGCRWGAGIGLLIAGAGGALRAYTESPNGLIGCMLVLGAGTRIFTPNAPKALSIWFPPNQLCLANGLYCAGPGLGVMVAMALSANFLSPALGGWRGMMLVSGGLSLFVAIIWMLLYRDRKVEESIEEKGRNFLENIGRALKIKDVWLLSIFFGVWMMGVISIEIFLPICLQEKGIERAGELVSNYAGTIVVFTILGGIISDKLGKRKPLLIFGAVITGLFAIPLPTLSVIPLIIALIICGTGFGVIIPVLFTMPAEMKEIGTELTATVIGLFLMFEGIGAFLGPIIAGKLIDITGSYLEAYIFMGVTSIVAAAFCMPVKDTGSKSRQDADGR